MVRYRKRLTEGDRREALCAWLQANGINPNDVPIRGDLYLEPSPAGDPYTGRYIHYEAFHRDSDGHRHVDERGTKVAVERRSTPLLVDPPDWWEPYRKPTREQLLGAVESLRKLIEKGSPPSEDGWAWEDGYSNALYAVEAILNNQAQP